MGRQVCGRLAGHCPDGPEGSRESGLLAVLIGGGEDAAVEMLAAGKTDETEGLGRLGGEHCGRGIFP